MKTPIQDLIEFMQKKFNILRENDLGIALEIGDCIEHAESLLEKEQKVAQLYAEFAIECDRKELKPLDFNGFVKVYNETFNTKEVIKKTYGQSI